MLFKSIIKNLSFISRIASFILIVFSLTIGSSALAQPVSQDGLLYGLTTFYQNQEQQANAVESLVKNTKYKDPECEAFNDGIVIPFKLPSKPEFLQKCAGDGSFQVADLDFTLSTPSIPDTNKRISFSMSVEKEGDKTSTPKIYAVIAGVPEPEACPVVIADTQVAFFKTKDEAIKKSAELLDNQYIVYVSPDPKVQGASLMKIKCNEVGKVIVSGATKKVTVDFRGVYELMNPNIQNTAKNSVFTYTPKNGSNYIYLLNARAKYGSK